MKSLIKIFLLLVISILTSCKTREKEVSKNETKSETFSKSEIKIERKTIDFVFNKSLFTRDFSYKSSAEETGKTEKKNIDKGKEYYENGNLKKEWERDLSEQSEFSKKYETKLQEKLSKSEETSKYWQESTDHFYKALEQEKKKTSNYEMKLKAKETFTWQMFFVGLLVGWIALPNVWHWFKSWLLRFNPYLKFLEWLQSSYRQN